MPASKKPRKRYKPIPVFADPVGAAIECATLFRVANPAHYKQLLLRNQAALLSIERGVCDRTNMSKLMGMSNMVEALWQMGFGLEHEDIVIAGQRAIKDLAQRGVVRKDRFVGTGQELQAIRALLELHEAQLGIVTVGEIQKALVIIERQEAAGRCVKIKTN